MDFELTEDQAMLADSLRRTLADAVPLPPRSREVQAAPYGATPAAWAACAGLGLPALLLPEELGGFGGTGVEVMLAGIELGRVLARVPMAEASVAAAIALTGAGGQDEALAALAAGDAVWGVALDCPGLRVDGIEGGVRLSGEVRQVAGGAGAGNILLCAAIDGASVLLHVDPEGPGITRRDHPAFDGSGLTDLGFGEGASATVLAHGDAATALARRIGDLLTLAWAAQALGAMERAFELTTDYVGTRRQFGRPISAFQAVRHRVADMFGRMDMARSMLIRASALDRRPSAEAAALAAAARIMVLDAAKYVCAEAIQLHGGIGIADEHAVGHCYKRILALDLLLGSRAEAQARFTAGT